MLKSHSWFIGWLYVIFSSLSLYFIQKGMSPLPVNVYKILGFWRLGTLSKGAGLYCFILAITRDLDYPKGHWYSCLLGQIRGTKTPDSHGRPLVCVGTFLIWFVTRIESNQHKWYIYTCKGLCIYVFVLRFLNFGLFFIKYWKCTASFKGSFK